MPAATPKPLGWVLPLAPPFLPSEPYAEGGPRLSLQTAKGGAAGTHSILVPGPDACAWGN